MQRTQLQTLDAGRRVQALLDEHPDTIGQYVSPKQRNELDSAVDRLTLHQADQSLSTDVRAGETASLRSQRWALYDEFVHPISAIARRVLRHAPEYPVFRSEWKAARRKQFAGDVASMVNVAEIYEKEFIANGMPADFIARMRAAIASLLASEQSRGLRAGVRSGATAGLVAAESEVRSILSTLDVLLKSRLKRDPALQAQWKSSRKIIKQRVMPYPTGAPLTAAETVSTTAGLAAPAAPALPQLRLLEGPGMLAKIGLAFAPSRASASQPTPAPRDEPAARSRSAPGDQPVSPTPRAAGQA